MKKFALLILFVASVVMAQAQKPIVVTESEQIVDKIRRVGLSTVIEVDDKLVDKMWKDKLKDFGKVKSSGSEYFIEVANVPGVSSRCVVTSVVEKVKGGTKVWWSIDMGTQHVSKGSAGYSGAEKILYNFAVEVYREEIQEQIDEATDALEDAQKDLDKEVKEGEDLVDDIADNKETIKKLQEENVQLEKDVEQNKQDQKALQEVIKTRQAELEKVKEKLTQVK